MRPKVGDYLRITRLRGNSGVWWAMVTEARPMTTPFGDVLYGPKFDQHMLTFQPPLRHWALEDDQRTTYTIVDECDLPDEFYAAQAAHTLLGVANSTD
jgi:hypothetical protein